jgi:hypothetical protein
MKRYGLVGERSRELLTHGGRVLWHTDAAELGYLVPVGAGTTELPPDIPAAETLHISQHPQMAAVSWPLNRRDFRG